jgi:uncharacterized protein YaiE (UPF0345 family)
MHATSRPDDRSRPRARGWQEWPTDEAERVVGSPAWWLTQPHQFLVDDDAQQPVGVVDDVEVQPDTGAPHELVVVQGWGRRRVVIPIDAVAEIMPAERRLIVRRSTQQRWRRLDRRRAPGAG